MDGNVSCQKPFAHASERPQEITQSGPHTLGRIHMDFAYAVAIVIACPLMTTMRDSRMSAVKAVITGILIGIDVSVQRSEVFHVTLQRHPFRIDNNSQPNLTPFASNRAENWGTVIGKSSPSAPFISPRPWGVGGVGVFDSFFPPNSGTSRRFRCSDRGALYSVAGLEPGLVSDAAITR